LLGTVFIVLGPAQAINGSVLGLWLALIGWFLWRRLRAERPSHSIPMRGAHRAPGDRGPAARR
jgi:hypothetical protein